MQDLLVPDAPPVRAGHLQRQHRRARHVPACRSRQSAPLGIAILVGPRALEAEGLPSEQGGDRGHDGRHLDEALRPGEVEQHCATLNLTFPVKGLSAIEILSFLMRHAAADAEVVLNGASLVAVSPAPSGQGWQELLYAAAAMSTTMALMSFSLGCSCGWRCRSRRRVPGRPRQ